MPKRSCRYHIKLDIHTMYVQNENVNRAHTTERMVKDSRRADRWIFILVTMKSNLYYQCIKC